MKYQVNPLQVLFTKPKICEGKKIDTQYNAQVKVSSTAKTKVIEAQKQRKSKFSVTSQYTSAPTIYASQ